MEILVFIGFAVAGVIAQRIWSIGNDVQDIKFLMEELVRSEKVKNVRSDRHSN